MSSIVSRRPPFWGSVSQAKDLRWISMRFGTSRTLSRRAKLRRVRGASTEATGATPRNVETGQAGAHEVRPAKIAQQAHAHPARATGSHGPRPANRVCGAVRFWDGCGYWPITGQCSRKIGDLPAGTAVASESAPSSMAAAPSALIAFSVTKREPASGFGCGGSYGGPGIRPDLLQFDGGACLFEVGLELVGLFAVGALLNRLGRLVDQCLGLLEAQPGSGADDLDHLDLLVAGGGEDDVEGGLLLACAIALGRSRGRPGGGRRCHCGGRYAELLLQRLDALGQLEHRDALELVYPLLRRGHASSLDSVCSSPTSVSSTSGAASTGCSPPASSPT